MARFDSLSGWLAWQETLHPKRIDLGLDRVTAVARTLQLLTPEHPVISVAGTNGKGSSVAMLESILQAAGYRVGCYTSPHIQRYNERIRIAGKMVTDAQLMAAFIAIDQARADISLSYFEFGTLAALFLFHQARLDVALLEVGLGGRLDAVNIIDADVALITAIGIDHTDWLGDSRESIGAEKAGIVRAHHPVICSDPRPPESVRRQARLLQAEWYAPPDGYHWTHDATCWNWQSESTSYAALPLPVLKGEHQLQNAAGVLMVLDVLSSRLPVTRAAVEQGLTTLELPGRCQIISGTIETVIDVAHNPDGARQLVQLLEHLPQRKSTRVVLGMLTGKDISAFAAVLAGQTDVWYLATLPPPRGLTAEVLNDAISGLDPQANTHLFACVEDALVQARHDASRGDRIVICGSFITVAEALASPV